MQERPHTVITGANRGIGLALAQHYAGIGHAVTGLVRTSSAALDAVAHQVISGAELTQAAGISQASHALADHPIDQLINVAGIMHWEKLDALDLQLVRTQMEINAFAPLALTSALLDRLAEGAKVVFLTSRLGSMADNTSGSGYGYRMSKAALNMAAKTLAIDLAPRGISVGLLHPGSVKTTLNQLGGEIEVDVAVAGLAARIEEMNLSNTGSYRHQNGTDLPW